MVISMRTQVEVISSCIDACQRAHHNCLDAAQRLIETQPTLSGSKLLEGLTHCIGMTRLAAEMMLTNSGSHGAACELCMKVCRDCADLCKGDPELEVCMKSCLECAHCCQLAMDNVGA